MIDGNNSTTVPLGAGGVFTGQGSDVSGFQSIMVMAQSNRASATDGLQIQFSGDNSHWDVAYSYTLAAGTGATFGHTVQGRFCRVVYTNGGTAQNAFRLTTMLTSQSIGDDLGSAGGGGSSGAVTLADGASPGVGGIGDSAQTDPTQAASLIALAKGLLTLLDGVLSVSATSLPLPTGAALESGGNLATLAGKDFATQTTLALIKAKTDNLDTALSGIKTGTDKIVTGGATAALQTTGNTSLASLLEALRPSDPVVASGTGAAQANTATLVGTSGKKTYLSGFEVTGAGATLGSTISITVAGIQGGTLTYLLGIPAGVALALTPLIVSFNPPIPASAANTDIVISVPSFGTGNLLSSVVAHGYRV